jgi:putative pyruvate formate lyase activating enzyme
MTKNPAVLRGRAEEARERLRRCDVCPRMCGAHRLEERVGTCRIGSRAVVSSAFAHFGEEEPLVGFHGSGTIFFAGCNLHCAFCQNFDISHSRTGRKVTGEQLGTMMLGLQESGCHNINLVTPSHVVPQILDGLANAVERGLRIPIVYNSSGYDDAGMLRALEGAIDIYMPDFKVWEPHAAKRYLSATSSSIRTAWPSGAFSSRHLVMPNGVAGSRRIFRYLARRVSPETYVNVMNQYRPWGFADRFEPIAMALDPKEFHAAVNAAREEGLTRLEGDSPGLRFQPWL